MNYWLIFALLAPAVYAAVTFIDRYLVSKEVKDYNAMPIFTATAGVLGGTLFWIFFGRPSLSSADTLLVLSTGILTAWSLVVYFRALSIEETSIVNLLFQMFPLFSIILAFFFLKESISLKQFIGFFLVLISSVLVSYDNDGKKFKISKAFYLILVYDILWAISGIIMKFVINGNSFTKVLPYESWGIGLGGLTIFIFVKKIRQAFLRKITKIKLKGLGLIFLNEGTFIMARTLTFLAFSMGPVGLVSVLENTQSFYAIFFGFLLTLILPRVFREDITLKGLGKKIIAAIILCFGIFLIK